jgi:hypothetical protein
MTYHRPASFGDALRVLKDMRPEDKAEVQGMGYPLLHAPFGVLISEHATYFHDVDGSPAGMAGVVRLSPTEGQIWMLCTPLITTKPITFVRGAKAWLKEVEQHYQMLWNLADARNHVHHKLLKHLGFKALRTVPMGPELLPYFEIVKLCAYPQQV